MLLLLLGAAFADTCPAWSPSAEPIEIASAPVGQSSGLAASRARPGVLYTHEDHNGASDLYAVTTDGTFVGVNDVRGALNEDWEDLAAAPCPDEGDCLYIGDIGDNDLQRSSIQVHIAREPDSDDGSAKVIRTLEATWPGGARDCEAMLVHPCTGEVYLAVKALGNSFEIWKFRPEAHKQTRDLELVAEMTLPSSSGQTKLTGGAFDVDGDRAALRSQDVVWEWVVDPDDPEAHWTEAPQVLELPLGEPEAIAYTLDGDLVSSSEDFPMTMSLLECEAIEPPAGDCVFVFEEGCGCDSSRSIPFPLGILVVFFMLYSRRSLDA